MQKNILRTLNSLLVCGCYARKSYGCKTSIYICRYPVGLYVFNAELCVVIYIYFFASI